MTAFYLKLFITPSLMLAISLAAKRWGTQIGGLLSGLPVTSALVMLFLGLEQGPDFALKAVPGALAGLTAVQATFLFYFLVTKKLGAPLGCILALGLYAAVAWTMSQLGLPALSVTATLMLISLIVVATSRLTQAPSGQVVPVPRWTIPMRMLTATSLLVIITTSAEWLGPLLSGLLAPVPVIAWPLAVFAHVQGGRQELGAIVRGNAIGAVGVTGFYLTVKATILPWGMAMSLSAAVLLAVVVTFGLARALNRGN